MDKSILLRELYASEEAKPFNPDDFDFAMDEGEGEPSMEAAAAIPNVGESNPARPLKATVRPRSNRVLGMTPPQLAVIVGLAVVLLCILVGFGYLIYTTT